MAINAAATPIVSGLRPAASVPSVPRGAGKALALPLCRFIVVARARLDPARAIGGLLLLPKRRPGLEIVHDELAGGKRLATMRAGYHHEHDLITGLELAHAV